MSLEVGGATEDEFMHARTALGLISIGRGVIYAGLNQSPVKIVKVKIGTMEKIATLTLESGENELSDFGALLIVGDYLYAVNAATLVKIDLKTFTRVSALTMPVTGWRSLAYSGGYLYAGAVWGRGRITKVDLSTFSIVSTLELLAPVASASGKNLQIGENYLYVINGNDTPSHISKIDLTTFTIDSTLTLPTGDRFAYSGLIKNRYLYVGCTADGPGRIDKIDLSTFTKETHLNLDTNENAPRNLEEKNNQLYVSNSWAAESRIIKINLANFSRVGALTLAADEDPIRELRVKGKNLYGAINTDPGKLVEIDLPTFTKTATLTLATGEESAVALAK